MLRRTVIVTFIKIQKKRRTVKGNIFCYLKKADSRRTHVCSCALLFSARLSDNSSNGKWVLLASPHGKLVQIPVSQSTGYLLKTVNMSLLLACPFKKKTTYILRGTLGAATTQRDNTFQPPQEVYVRVLA